MNSIERGDYELDPSYDPERIETKNADTENSHENEADLRLEPEVFRDNEQIVKGEAGVAIDVLGDSPTKLIRMIVPEYEFKNSNPYEWSLPKPCSLSSIARQVDSVIARGFSGKSILVRALQSGSVGMARTEIIRRITTLGYDKPYADDAYDFHAAKYDPFTKDSSLLEVFEAFHKWKPKCEERPQLPIDVIEIFDAESYISVEYNHPRHSVASNDRYKLKVSISRTDALLAIILIN